MGWRSKMERARRLHRPSLKNWEQDGLFLTFSAFVEALQREPNYQVTQLVTTSSNHSPQPTTAASLPPSLPVVLNADFVSPETFASQYEANEIPSVIQNIPNGPQPWSALRNWSLDVLGNDLDLRNRVFKCGEDDDGKSIKVYVSFVLTIAPYLPTSRYDVSYTLCVLLEFTIESSSIFLPIFRRIEMIHLFTYSILPLMTIVVRKSCWVRLPCNKNTFVPRFSYLNDCSLLL
jgi:hypothetical protein